MYITYLKLDMADLEASKSAGYATPLDALNNGPREKLIYVPCIRSNSDLPDKPDYIATVDVDPTSPTFSQVIHRLPMPSAGDEPHHADCTACSKGNNTTNTRDKIVFPCLGSDRVYILDVGASPRAPTIHHIVGPDTGGSAQHKTHCLGSGQVMVGTTGDLEGAGKGGLISLGGESHKTSGVRNKDGKTAPSGADFWYQPRHNVMINTDMGAVGGQQPEAGPDHVEKGEHGNSLNVWRWDTHELIQRIELGEEGVIPLEVRFLHEPSESQGFVGCAWSSTVFRFFKTGGGRWDVEKVVTIPAKAVEGWVMPNMPGLITDIVLSLDDKYMYLTNWLHGDIRQYDLSDTSNPKLVGQVFLGGSIVKDGAVKVTNDSELNEQPAPVTIQDKVIEGGPQKFQLSLDGKRIYVSTSIFSLGDEQFYPDMVKDGSLMLLVDVDTVSGGLTLNEEFCVDFGKEPEGPALAHEMRYSGADCTSDIWL